MYDPIICEVRKVREELAREANYDVPTVIELVNEEAKKIKGNQKWKYAKRENGKFVIVER